MSKLKIFISLCIVNCALLIGTAGAQDFGIYDLSAKTNLDSTDAFMISQAVDSTYYKVLWDRIVDSVEDSIRGNIMNNWINSAAAIGLNKLASGTASYIVMANVSGVPTYTAMSGDATISNSGVLTISANAIGSAEITNNSITTDDILDDDVSSADIENGTILNEDISSSAAIALSKLASGTQGYIIVNNSSGVPTSVAMSGDATITNTGVVDISDTLSDDFVFTGKHAYTPQLANNWTGGAQTLNGTGLKRFVVIDVGATSGVEITDITNAVDGQLLTIFASGDAYEGFTIKNNTEILLSGAVDITSMDAWSSVTLVYIAAPDLWIEVSRSIR